jgi:tRNA (guanine-N(7)-)-methyltransferase
MRKIKSYARIIGKSLSFSRKMLLENVLPEYQIDQSKIANLQNLHMEIGFGDGQYLYDLAINNPQHNFLGIEVYLNGVCNLLKACGLNRPKNLFIYPGDADLILELIPDDFICAFYILFPDPWPKPRQQKRRFLNQQRIELMIAKLKPSGVLKFATDVESYFTQVETLLSDQAVLQLQNGHINNFENLSKYHQKAVNLKKKIYTLCAIKKHNIK